MIQEIEDKKNKNGIGVVFWVLLICGAALGGQTQSPLLSLGGSIFIIISFVLGGVWIFRKFKKTSNKN